MCVWCVAPALAFCLLALAACEGSSDGEPAATFPKPSESSYSAELRFQPTTGWMPGYCRKAANDLGYAVLCPTLLPHPIEIIPCYGPAPEEELWGEYCFDDVLDVLFTGPPGFRGPFRFNRRTGHMAMWAIGPGSDFYPHGLFACPEGGERKQPDRIAGYGGEWWICPATKTANLNSGHVAFQWLTNDVVYEVGVHRVTDVGRQIVRAEIMTLDLVIPS